MTNLKFKLLSKLVCYVNVIGFVKNIFAKNDFSKENIWSVKECILNIFLLSINGIS